MVFEPPTTLLQTVYDEDPSFLTAIAFDEFTGKIATCTERIVRIYRPYGQNEEALKVIGCTLLPRMISLTVVSGRSRYPFMSTI